MLHGRHMVKSYKISQGSLDVSTLSTPTVPMPDLTGLPPMYRMKEIKKYALILFKQYKLEAWTFGYDSAKTRAGCCYGRRKHITLSEHLIVGNNVPEIIDTLLHEIAHGIDSEDRGTSDHSPRWVAIARAIGCNGNRCYNKDEKVMPEGKHLYKCPKCEREVRYHKKKKRATACGKCCKAHNGGRYDAKYAFTYLGIKPVQISIPSPKVVPVHTNLASANMAATSKTDQMKALYDSGITSISEIAKTVGAHYSHVHTVIKKHKG